ncbi:centrosomal protein 43-like isoform X1 [Saccostrea echinata]|uniref:centrosomal protein 43-like isoform X1 n=1 Tax=Saccostrea echinata TaxID=191078 RepID=UPI002A819DF8|nr:centrosomal protein 43-like isoform X1 [Saccostrea echinata]
MSADEDTELRDLVAQTLEANGVLGKIRAQLRASVFLALEEQEQNQDKPFANPALRQYLSTKEGQAVAGLVREFLDFFQLDYTLAVFEPEAGLGPNNGGRQQLAKELNILESDGPPKGPLLGVLVSGNKQTAPLTKVSDELTPAQIAEAKQKFNYYDKNHSGDIDKNELRELFIDICPGFNRNMIERYVNEEFKAADTDFSSSKLGASRINFEEFLGMYKRLFIQCRTVVSGEVSGLVNSHKANERKEFVEAKNQRNLQSSLNDQRKKPNAEVDLLGGSDVEIDDPFFDDPVPHSHGLKGLGTMAETTVDSRRGMGSRPSQIPVYSPLRSANSSVSSDSGKDGKPSLNGSGQGHSVQSSLSGLPNLTPSKTRKALESEEENLRAMDRGMADLGLDMGDFDYDDDFQSSGHSLTKSPHTISKSEQRSEQNGSIAEEIEEEIDDISIEADDMLRSERSGFDDLTTDRTISQQDGFDYVEDLQSPR